MDIKGAKIAAESRNLSSGGSVSPSECVPGFPPGAHVFTENLRAVLTVHLAAPVELAVAAARHLRAPLLHPEAAVVAQPAAAAPLRRGGARAVLRALPALGAGEPQTGVPPAVVRRVLQVD